MTSVAQPISEVSPTEARCPVCERVLKRPHRAKSLFGLPVCNRCRNGFANRRQFAYILDAVIWTFGVGFIYDGITFILGVQPVQTGAAPAALPGLVVTMMGLDSLAGFIWVWVLPLIFFCKDGFSGMSPGKWLMGVQVIDTTTREPIGFGQSLKRNLVLMIPFAVLFVAFTMLKGRRAGDRWANTEVIWRKHAFRPPFDPSGVLCRHCGYDLTGNVSGKCPECFTPVTGERSIERSGVA